MGLFAFAPCRGQKSLATANLGPYRGQRTGDAIDMEMKDRGKAGPMSALTRIQTRGLFPDIFAWLESPFTALRPFMAQPMRLEDYIDDGHYVIRAELPGIDPGKQVEVTVSKGILTIHAERHEDTKTRHRSEFYYGVYSRHVQLPPSANEDDITATYDKGILEVKVGLQEKEQVAGRQIPVKPAGEFKKAS
jgi:HSP20 family protein